MSQADRGRPSQVIRVRTKNKGGYWPSRDGTKIMGKNKGY
jgi:hypothetical protein